MANGSEDSDTPSTEGSMVTHFDVKSDNYKLHISINIPSNPHNSRGKLDEYHIIDRTVKISHPIHPIHPSLKPTDSDLASKFHPSKNLAKATNSPSTQASIKHLTGRTTGICTNTWGVAATMLDVLG